MIYVGIFAALNFLGLLLFGCRALLMARHRVKVSSSMHGAALKAVMNAPISFFDVTPTGRLLNRFSSDFQIIDEELSQTLTQVPFSQYTCVWVISLLATYYSMLYHC
jgi:ABC-type multidrug transport system fused ATPase/permease subunit